MLELLLGLIPGMKSGPSRRFDSLTKMMSRSTVKGMGKGYNVYEVEGGCQVDAVMLEHSLFII